MKGKSLIFVAADGQRQPVKVASAELASGADGAIYQLEGLPALVAGPAVAKLYHPERLDEERQLKLQAMLGNAPELPAVESAGRRYVQLAWPLGMLYEGNGRQQRFVGYAMPAVDLQRSVTLESLLSEKSRQAYGLPNHYGYQLAAAYNVVAMLAELHAHGHHVIDLKPVNINVYTDKLFIAMLDCDGFSISAASHSNTEHFPAHQYTADYIAPEAWKSRQPPEALGEQQDLFALAVILFRLLNRGLHPYQGVPSAAVSDISSNQDRISADLYAYGLRPNRKIAPSPWSLHEQLPLELRRLFDQAFTDNSAGHAVGRPTPQQWLQALQPFVDPASGQLLACRKNADHALFAGLECGHCLIEQRRRALVKRPRQGATKAAQHKHRSNPMRGTAAAVPQTPATAPRNTGQRAGQTPRQVAATVVSRLQSIALWPNPLRAWARSGWSKWAWPLFLILGIGTWQLQANRQMFVDWLVAQRYQVPAAEAKAIAELPVGSLPQAWRLAINSQNFPRMLALLKAQPANTISPDESACCETVDVEMQYPYKHSLQIQPPETRLPLGYAAAQPGGINAVVTLLGLGFDPLKTDADGFHAIDVAAYYGRPEALEVLLDAVDSDDYHKMQQAKSARKMAFYGRGNSYEKTLQLLNILEDAGVKRRRYSRADSDKYENLIHRISWYNRHRRFRIEEQYEPEAGIWKGKAD